MPTYVYKCKRHGHREVTKPHSRAPEQEFCDSCAIEAQRAERSGFHWVNPPVPMERVYTGFAMIMRPDGYSLQPGDRGYWNLDRQGELGQLRGPSATQNKHIDASLLERGPDPKIELSDSQMRDIRNVGEMVDREIRSGNVYIPETFRDQS